MSIPPRGLTGRAILVLLAAVALVHFGSMLIYERGLVDSARPGWEADGRQRLASALTLITREAPADRSAMAALLSSDNFQLDMIPAAADGAPPNGSIVDPTSDKVGTAGMVPLDDGTMLRFQLRTNPHEGHATHATLLSTTVMVVGVVVVAALLVRGIVAPLRRLARAADTIGHTTDPRPITEQGPNEVRQVARAFNAMQQRIDRLIQDRTQALAAVSHDLRTPITRLRLRAGFVSDPEIQRSIDRDLDDMDTMVEATLAYLGGEQETEKPRPTDLPALLETLVDAETDQGRTASYAGPAHLTVTMRSLSMKRAFANLIANAVSYGGAARVALRIEQSGPMVTIDDDGPGIPEADIPRAFEPFVRLEQSRNRGTGGVGLGLTIARRAVAAEGGTLELQNRGGGGLTVRVLLPTSVLVAPKIERSPTDAQMHTPPATHRRGDSLAASGAGGHRGENL